MLARHLDVREADTVHHVQDIAYDSDASSKLYTIVIRGIGLCYFAFAPLHNVSNSKQVVFVHMNATSLY